MRLAGQWCPLGGPADLPREAEEDAGLVRVERRAAEQAAKGAHHVDAVVAMEEADGAKRVLQHLVYALDARRVGERWYVVHGRTPGRVGRQAQLVPADEDGLRQVERRVRVDGRNGEHALAAHELVVRETGVLGTEDERDVVRRARGEDRGREGA